MADVTLDKITIEIEGSATKANKVIEDLEKNMKNLKSAMSGFNTSSLDNLVSKLNGVSNALDRVVNNSNKANNITVKPNIDTSGISKGEKRVQTSIDKIRVNLAGLGEFATSAMSGDNSAFTSFERRTLSIQSAIDSARQEIVNLGEVKLPTEKFLELESKIDNTKSRIQELLDKENELYEGGVNQGAGDQWTSLQTEIGKATEELNGYIVKQTEMVDAGTAYINPFQGYEDALDSVQSQLNDTKSTVETTVSEMNSSSINIDTSTVISNLKSVGKETMATLKKLLKLGSNAVKGAINGLSSALSKVKSGISSVGEKTSSLSNIMNTGFMKVLKYGFGIRSLYVLFRRLRTAITDSFTELQNSGAFYETTRSNIEALKTSLTTLKYQFGAAFEPIFNTVAPALQTLINYLVAAMNTLSAFIAKITGKSTYSKAVASTAEIASNTGSAADNAKEMNKQLQGFDELNNLSSSSGGSGGSGGSGSDASGVTYVEENVDSALSSFWQTMADYIKNGDWKGLGSTISAKLTDMMNSIPWSKIFQKAANFGKNLAEFLNGLITDDLFSALGTTIANAIKTALISIISFGENFSWSGLGSAIASGINAFVKQNPLSLAVKAFNVWANGILDTLITAIDNIEWKDIAQHIADGIAEIDASGIGWKLGKLVSSLASALATLVSQKSTWTNLGTKLGEGLSSFFNSLSENKGWENIGTIIGESLKGITTTLTLALKKVNWEEVGQGIADMIKAINWDEVKFEFGNLVGAIKDAIIGLVKGLDIDAKDVFVTITKIGLIVAAISSFLLAKTITSIALTAMVETAVRNLIASGGAVELFKAAGLALKIAGVTVAMAAAATIGWQFGKTLGEFIATWMANKGIITKQSADEYSVANEMTLTQKISDIKLSIQEGTFSKAVKLMWEDIKSYFKEVPSSVKEIGGYLIDGIKEGVTNKVSKIGSWVKEKFGKITDAVKDFFGIKSPSTVFKEIGENIIEGLKNGLKAKVDQIKSWIKKNVTDKIKGFFNGVKTITISIAGKVLDSFTSAKELWDDFEDKAVELVASAKEKVKDAIKNLKNQWDNFPVDVKKLYTDAKEKAEGAIDKLKKAWNDWIPAVKDLVTNAREAAEDKLKGSIQWLKEKWDKWRNTDDTKTLKANATDGGTIATTQKNWNNATFSAKSLSVSWDKNSATTLSEWNNVKDNKNPGVTKAIKLVEGTSKSGSFSAEKTKWDSIADGVSATKTVKVSADSTLNDAYNKWKYFNDYKTSSLSVTFNDSFTKQLRQAWNDMVNNITSALQSKKMSTASVPNTIATGGIIGSNGVLHRIAQYAGGTLDAFKHGSVFVVGENGPEVMGHINGKTEILNRSQIASTVFQAITNGMRQFRNAQMVQPPKLAFANDAVASMGSFNSGYGNDALIAEQNELLAEQNRLLQQIAQKDVSISSRDVFNATRDESNNYYNRTGNSPFLF